MKWQKGDLITVIGLYLLIIPFFNALNATGYENAQIQGHFGVSSTGFMYMTMVPFFVLVAGIPLALNLAARFPMRSLMFTTISLCFVFNTLSAYAPDGFFFTLSRSLLSFFMIFGILTALIPIAVRYNPAMNMAIMYGIVQFIIQGSSLLYKYFGALFAHIYDWRTSILLVNINFLLCIVLAWIFIKKNTAPAGKIPGFDFKGWGLLILFLFPFLFLSAEGQVREWFSDRYVIIALILIPVLASVYFIYSQKAKNPLINPEVFNYRNLVVGTFLYFITGAINSTGSVVLGFMGGILGFDDLYMARTHLYIFAGLTISVPLCTYLLFKKTNLQLIAVAGFVFFALYHGLMYKRFYPGIAPADFMWPLLFKGAGIGFLYVLSSLYISENIPKALSVSRMMSGVIARVIIGIILAGSVLSTFVSKLTVQHTTGISQQLRSVNKKAEDEYLTTRSYYILQGLKPAEADRFADNPLRRDTSTPAAMLAYKDIYLVMTVLCLIPAVVIPVFRLGRRGIRRVEVEPIPL
jgi:DHA2 family multidrug resistance protein